MSTFKLIKQSKLALSKENELTYYGGKYKKLFSNILKKPKFSGFFFQTLIFFYRVFESFNLFNKNISQKNIYIFAETVNQLSGLKTTIESLNKNINEIHLTVSKTLLKKNLDFKTATPISFNLNVIFTSIILFLTRGIPLYFRLKKKNQEINISSRFNEICMTYIFIPYFLDILKKLKPKIIITSNDHNLNNRCLRLSAEVLGIKTMYLQHASVSDIFPPLEFDYALLDGEIAHQIYLKCYNNKKKKNINLEKNVANCKIILSGLKKEISKKIKKEKFGTFNFGLAVNELDNFDGVKFVLDRILLAGEKCIIRTHPHQPQVFIKKLQEYLKKNDSLIWSDAGKESISDYFINLNVLIAGNSSIHLEAALAGLVTYYYEMGEEFGKPDQYEYIKNGLTSKLNKDFSFESLKSDIEKKQNLFERKQAIKNYSETFGTLWQNQEGKLTALIINHILKNEKLDDLFLIKSSEVYHSIGYLLQPNTKNL